MGDPRARRRASGWFSRGPVVARRVDTAPARRLSRLLADAAAARRAARRAGTRRAAARRSRGRISLASSSARRRARRRRRRAGAASPSSCPSRRCIPRVDVTASGISNTRRREADRDVRALRDVDEQRCPRLAPASIEEAQVEQRVSREVQRQIEEREQAEQPAERDRAC